MGKLNKLQKPAEKKKFEVTITPARIAVFAVIAIAALLVYSHWHINGANAANSANPIEVDYYYSFSCHICAETTPVFAQVADDFGSNILFVKKCVTLIGEDNTKCIAEEGPANYQQYMREITQYAFNGTPSYLIGGEKGGGRISKDGLKARICNKLYGISNYFDLMGQRINACK